MAGYTRHWDCWICKDAIETILYPKILVCDRCLRVLASELCQRELNTALDTPGVDENFWMDRALQYASLLLLRRKP